MPPGSAPGDLRCMERWELFGACISGGLRASRGRFGVSQRRRRGVREGVDCPRQAEAVWQSRRSRLGRVRGFGAARGGPTTVSYILGLGASGELGGLRAAVLDTEGDGGASWTGGRRRQANMHGGCEADGREGGRRVRRRRAWGRRRTDWKGNTNSGRLERVVVFVEGCSG